MQVLLPNSNPEFRRPLLDLLWRQWSALGVAGSAESGAAGCIDIEALVLITTLQGRYEARLFDEMLDWLWSNGNWVNVQRLRNLHRRLALGHPRVLAAIADFLSQRAVLSKWKPLAKPESVEVPAQPEPLFLHDDGKASLVFGTADPIFNRWGFWRGPCSLRHLSRAPNPLPAHNLLFKLRALFGVQSRCEVLLWLLTNQAGRPADVARATCYFPRTVEDTLKELAESGLIREARSGRERHYALDPTEWDFLRTWKTPPGFPDWIDWSRRFATIERISSVLSRTDLSEMLRASELLRVLEELQPILAEGGLISAFAASRKHTGVRFTEALMEDLGRLLAA